MNCPPVYPPPPPPPPHHGPPFFPPPPPPIPPQNINIYSGGSDKGQELIDDNQNKLLSALQLRVDNLELSGLTLGEVSGTAYPGDKGSTNAQSITIINTAISSILDRLDTFVSEDMLSSTLSEYSTVQATSDAILLVQDTLNANLSSAVDNLSAEIEGKGYTTSAVVSAMIKENEETYDYLSGLQEDVNNFLDEI